MKKVKQPPKTNEEMVTINLRLECGAAIAERAYKGKKPK